MHLKSHYQNESKKSLFYRIIIQRSKLINIIHESEKYKFYFILNEYFNCFIERYVVHIFLIPMISAHSLQLFFNFILIIDN